MPASVKDMLAAANAVVPDGVYEDLPALMTAWDA